MAKPFGHIERFNRIVEDGWLAKLSHPELATLIALEQHADLNGVTYPGQGTLADLIGQSTRSVKRAMQGLKAHGILKQIRKAAPGCCAKWQIVLTSANSGTCSAGDGCQSESERVPEPASTGAKTGTNGGHRMAHRTRGTREQASTSGNGDGLLPTAGEAADGGRDGGKTTISGEVVGYIVSTCKVKAHRKIMDALCKFQPTLAQVKALWHEMINTRSPAMRQGAMAAAIMAGDFTTQAGVTRTSDEPKLSQDAIDAIMSGDGPESPRPYTPRVNGERHAVARSDAMAATLADKSKARKEFDQRLALALMAIIERQPRLKPDELLEAGNFPASAENLAVAHRVHWKNQPPYCPG